MKNLFTAVKESVARYRDSDTRVSRKEYRKAVAELRGLSDAQLKDIGISRSNIIQSAKYGKQADQAA